MIFAPKTESPAPDFSAARLLRLAFVATLALSAAGCSTLDSLNPFGGEKYETKLLP